MPSSASSASSATASKASASSPPLSSPGISPPIEYALILIAITAIYVIKGGMISVVITEVVQFCILAIASFAVGIIAMRESCARRRCTAWCPAGWDNVFFGWHLNLDWSALDPRRQRQNRPGWLRHLRLLRHDAALQGRAVLRRRARPPTTICSASFPQKTRAKPP